MLNKIITTAIIIIILISACSPGSRKDKAIMGPDTNSICFENFRNLSFVVETGKFKIQNVPDIIECSGKILSSPDEIAIVTVPIQGIIKKLYVSPGSYVKKGMAIALVENPEILKMQEDFLVRKSDLEYYKEDFKRQGELNLENATSMKVMQKAQHEYVKAEAGFQSLKKRLELIGFNPDSIESEKLQSSIAIYAPLSGTISKVIANAGMYCTLETSICTISGNQNPILVLYTDVSNISKLVIGQLVEFSTPSNPDKKYTATITGYELNNNADLIITIYAQIRNEPLLIGMPVKATINAGTRSVITLPAESIIQSGGKSYLFNKTDENCFKIIEITTGKTIYTELEILYGIEKSDKSEYVISGTQHIFNKYELERAAFR